MPKYLGWDRNHSVRARTDMLASRKYFTVAAPAKAPRPAVSLGHLRMRILLQGATGTCWLHSPVMMFEMTAKAKGYDGFLACRRAIGYAAKQQYEGGGNMGGGGSPTDAVKVMTGAGVGVAHEDLCPYPVIDDEGGMTRALAVPPSPAVYADAQHTHLIGPVDVRNIDQIISLIDNGGQPGTPTCNGFSCPKALQDDPGPFLAQPGPTVGGHSLLITGYMLAGVKDQYRWLEGEGWWDELYQPLPPSIAKLVDGYEPTSPGQTTSKWFREDAYIYFCNLEGGSEHVTATDIEGLKSGTVEPADPTLWADYFPM